MLEKTGLTKGAFYHHFSSKQALGIAVVDELIHGKITDIWLDTLDNSNDPINAIQDAFEKSAECYGMDILMLGCPLNNLAQEMSPINEEFRLHINQIFHQWHQALVGVLERGIKAGNIIKEIDPLSVATFILACVEGSIGLAKNERDLAPIIRTTDEIDRYLGTLRPKNEILNMRQAQGCSGLATRGIYPRHQTLSAMLMPHFEQTLGTSTDPQFVKNCNCFLCVYYADK